jgi:phenylacetate-coenzyme A ligase PaaK-like adenylate-forming protein
MKSKLWSTERKSVKKSLLWQQSPEAVIRSWQADTFRKYLRNVVLPFSPYYRKLFAEHDLRHDSFRTLEDLQRIPFTTKADLVNTAASPQKFRDFIVVPDEKVLARRPGTVLRAIARGRQAVKEQFEAEFRPIFMTFTTGRSAEPTPVFYSQRDLAHLQTSGRRIIELCATRREDRVLNAFPFAPHLAFWQTHYAGTAAGVMMLSSGGGKVMGTEGTIRHICKFKPNAIIGMPTFLYHLLHQAAEQGVRCESLRGLVLGGEKVSDGLRTKLRELTGKLGAPDAYIVATYAFTEAKQAWPECAFPAERKSGGYHLYPDLGIMEVIDPATGESLPPGSPGELVFTPLDARGTVLLRYRTGDYTDGGLTYETCPHCGRTLPRLVGNISRSSEVKEMKLDKIKGTLVDFNELEHVLDDTPRIGAWQVELRKLNDDPLDLDELVLHVQKINGADEGQLSRELMERCAARLEIHPNRVIFHDADEIRQLQGVGVLLKEQKVVDHRPKGQNPLAPRNGNGASATAAVSSVH